jgi:hypothetical protein
MGLYPELEDLSLDELIERFHRSPLDGPEYSRAYYDEVAVLIAQQGDAGPSFLRGEIGRADADRLGAIFLALTFDGQNGSGLQEVLLSHLQHSDPYVIASAVRGLAALGAKQATDAVLSLQEHRSPFVRGSILEFLSRTDPESALPALLKALNDPDHIVRETAVDEIDDIGAIEALPAIRPLLADPHPSVRQATQGAIERLTERVHEEHEAPLS